MNHERESLNMPGRMVTAIPAHWYHDGSVYQQERRRVFAREWQWIGLQHQLEEPLSYITAEPAGFPVLVRRGEDGEIRGFHNVCRHRASKLLIESEGKCKRLICPYHGWRYGPEGALLNAPRFGESEDFDPAALGLFPVRVACWMGLVFVCMDLEAPGFAEWLGPIKERVEEYFDTPRVYHRDIVAEVDCNWKTYIDNYQEGYHIPLVHPQLAADIQWKEYRVVNVPGGSIHQVAERGGSGQPGLFGWKFPNFMFNCYGNGVSFMRIDPLGSRRCCITYSHFRPAKEDPETYEQGVVRYGWDVAVEDQFLAPLVQQNLEAGVYEAGPLSPRHENGVWYFHELLRASLLDRQ